MEFRPLAEARGFLYCYPDGTIAGPVGATGFWNATDACCDFGNTGVDDVGYLRGVIEEIARRFAVDRKRVYLIGHSNGGFMAYRMACESADLIAGIASLAGTTFSGPQPLPTFRTRQYPPHPRHGRRARVLRWWCLGPLPDWFPANLPPYPGAVQTVQIWAGYNGASDPVTDAAPSLDLDSDVRGAGHRRHALHDLPARRRGRTVDDQWWQPRSDALRGVFAPGH